MPGHHTRGQAPHTRPGQTTGGLAGHPGHPHHSPQASRHGSQHYVRVLSVPPCTLPHLLSGDPQTGFSTSQESSAIREVRILAKIVTPRCEPPLQIVHVCPDLSLHYLECWPALLAVHTDPTSVQRKEGKLTFEIGIVYCIKLFQVQAVYWKYYGVFLLSVHFS